MNKKIDFIGIGAHKSGTSWLYSCLMQLPDFSLPPIKEIHYFDRSSKYPSPNHLEKTNFIERVKNYNWTKEALITIIKHLLKGNFKRVKWYSKWYFSKYNDDWYLSLFNSFKGLTGEISPSYSILDEEDISKMYKIAPQARIIFLIRNPIDRAWSNFRFNSKFINNFDIRSVNTNDIEKFMNSKHQELRSNYIHTMENYSRIFPKNQILVCFYDAIKDNPLNLLNEIVKFIGGNTNHIEKYCNVSQKVNVSKEMEMPIAILDFLKEKYHGQIQHLAEVYGGYCSKWYSDLYEEHNVNKVEQLLPTTTMQ